MRKEPKRETVACGIVYEILGLILVYSDSLIQARAPQSEKGTKEKNRSMWYRIRNTRPGIIAIIDRLHFVAKH